MAEFAAEMKYYADLLESLGYFLPIIWACFVTAEWCSQRGYYKRFHIEHSFKPNYKIVFNPSYILSLLFSIFLWISTFLLQRVLGFTNRNIVLGIIFLAYCVCINNRLDTKKLLDQLVRVKHDTCLVEYKDKSGNIKERYEMVSSQYRQTFQKWKKYDENWKVLNLIWANWIVGCVIMYRLSYFAPNPLIDKAYRMVIQTFYSIENFRYFLCIIWFLAICLGVHCLFNDVSGKTGSLYNKIEYFRIINYQEKTYAVLAPNEIDNNGVCVALRTIICRKANGLIYGYLFQDESLTMHVPYEGESILVNVDKIGCIAPEEYMSALYPKLVIKRILKNQGIVEFLDNREWKTIDRFEQPLLLQ